MALKPWREVAVPHEDVLKGTFQQAEFAADLSRVPGTMIFPFVGNHTVRRISPRHCHKQLPRRD